MTTILVVDDEPDIRLLVSLTLGMDDHEVLEAGNGCEALEVVDRRHVDLIVLDVMMPERPGWDTLATLKAHPDPRHREIPVIMLTALSSPMDRVKGGIEGAVRYLAKPIAPDELRKAVAEALADGPEPAQRRQAQQRALEDLARLERSATGAPTPVAAGPRPRLSGLEPVRRFERAPAVTAASTIDLRVAAEGLTAQQRSLLVTISESPTVLAAAARLGTSRSNVYASLRRIARRLHVEDVAELLTHVRAGRVL